MGLFPSDFFFITIAIPCSPRSLDIANYSGKDEFGKDVRTTRSGFKTQKEAKQAYRELQLDFDKNKLKQNGNIPFEKLYEEFLQSYRNKVKPSTVMILRRAIEDHALQYIGKKKIKDIKCSSMYSNE